MHLISGCEVQVVIPPGSDGLAGGGGGEWGGGAEPRNVALRWAGDQRGIYFCSHLDSPLPKLSLLLTSDAK